MHRVENFDTYVALFVPSCVSEVFVLVFDGGVGDSGDAVLLLPVVSELTEPIEVSV